MIAYMKLKIILTCLFIHTLGVAESKKKYPRIQDVVSFSENGNLNFINRIVKNIKSYLNIEQYTSNQELFRRQIRGNLEDSVLLEGNPFKNRRVQKYRNDEEEYKVATNLQFRTKILDSMLQLVYMARHYLKLFERSEYVDKNSDAYRIGVIAKKLMLMYKKSTRILEILNVRQRKDLWVIYNTTAAALTLHHKVAKMHVDFNYYYEVLKRLHYKIRQIRRLPREKPPIKVSPQIW